MGAVTRAPRAAPAIVAPPGKISRAPLCPCYACCTCQFDDWGPQPAALPRLRGSGRLCCSHAVLHVWGSWPTAMRCFHRCLLLDLLETACCRRLPCSCSMSDAHPTPNVPSCLQKPCWLWGRGVCSFAHPHTTLCLQEKGKQGEGQKKKGNHHSGSSRGPCCALLVS